MTIATTMISPSASTGWVPASGDAPAGSDPQAFLQALLQQLQGLGDKAAESGQPIPPAESAGSENQEDLLSAIMDQLKKLLGSDEAGSVRTVVSGKEGDGGGKLLPDSTADGVQGLPDGANLAGLSEWLAQFINPPQTPTAEQPAGGEDAGGAAAPGASTIMVAVQAQAEADENGHADTGTFLQAALDMLNHGEKLAGDAAGSASVKELPAAQPALAQGTRTQSESGPVKSELDALDATEPGTSPAQADSFQQIMERQANEVVQPGPTSATMAFNPATQAVSPRPAPVESPAGLDRPLVHPAWSDDLGDRVLWMVGQGKQSAELRLNPAHLGPLEVRIELNRDQQASVQFLTHQPAVREAVESALPKLREMLGAQQLDVRDVSVSQYTPGDQRDQRTAQFAFGQQNSGSGRSETPYPGQDPRISGSGADEGGSAVATRVRANKGLLSLYA